MSKIKIDMDLLCEAFPEAKMLEVLPRKKKKALKKKIARMLISLLTEESHSILEKSFSLWEEIQNEAEKVSVQLEEIQNGKS